MSGLTASQKQHRKYFFFKKLLWLVTVGRCCKSTVYMKSKFRQRDKSTYILTFTTCNMNTQKEVQLKVWLYIAKVQEKNQHKLRWKNHRQAWNVCPSLCLVAVVLQLGNEIQPSQTPQSRPTGYNFSQHPDRRNVIKHKVVITK